MNKYSIVSILLILLQSITNSINDSRYLTSLNTKVTTNFHGLHNIDCVKISSAFKCLGECNKKTSCLSTTFDTVGRICNMYNSSLIIAQNSTKVQQGINTYSYKGCFMKSLIPTIIVPAGIKSINSATQFSLALKNDLQDMFQLYWIDYSGKAIFFNNVTSLKQITIPSFVTHVWALQNTRNCKVVGFLLGASPFLVSNQQVFVSSITTTLYDF